MSKKNKKVAKASLFAMMTEIWADVRSGKEDVKSISLQKYFNKYTVGKFKRSMILPYITQETCPTYEQACELRKEISNYIKERYKKQPKRTENIEATIGFDLNFMSKESVIDECIEFLKKEGYVVFKRV